MSTKEETDVPVAAAAVPVAETEAFSVPGGRWRKGLCGCFSACCCPCMMGMCCFPLLLGQLIERLGYNCFGCPTEGKSPPVCMIFATLWIIVLIIEVAVNASWWSAYECEDYSEDGSVYVSCTTNFSDLPAWYQVLVWILIIWAYFICIVSCCTRMNMRKQHNIDPACCGDNCVDDCMTTWCCNCCSTIQMVRQTHDEDQYPYVMGSRTGLGPDAPEIV